MDDKLEKLLAEIATQLQDAKVRAELREVMRPALRAALASEVSQQPLEELPAPRRSTLH